MTTATTIRLEESDKIQATDILKSMGLTLSGYLNMAVKQLINQQKVPFEIVAANPVPTAETSLAMLRAEAKAAGLIPDNDATFDNVDDFLASLED